jgi:hypothetical protein
MSVENIRQNSYNKEGINGNIQERHFNNLLDSLKSDKRLAYVQALEFPKPDQANMYPGQEEKAIVVAPTNPIYKMKEMEDFIRGYEKEFSKDPGVGKMRFHEPSWGGIIWVGQLVKDKTAENERTRIMFYPDDQPAKKAVDDYNRFGTRESYEGMFRSEISQIKRKVRRSMSKDKVFFVFSRQKQDPSAKQ